MSRKCLIFAPLLVAACAPNAGNPLNADDKADTPPVAQSPAGTSSEKITDSASSDGDKLSPQTGGEMPVPPDPSNDCAAITGSEFKAWVNAMPGPNSRSKLIVTGTVTAPTGGYRVSFTDMRVAESYPVQVTVELSAVPPSGPATQAVTSHEVRGQWPMSPPVGSVTVRCGRKTLARISPVETAH